MAINLNTFKPSSQVSSALKQGYLYKDINFDLKYGYTTNSELYSASEKKDLVAIYDVNSVLNAIKNILTTSPGEKILNPNFGLDLRDFLFDAVSETAGFFLGERILTELPLQDDRLVVNRIKVLVRPDDQEYVIDLDIGIPSLNIPSITLNGVLNNDGYVFA
jgi:phage baseplate assembly protein W